MTKTLTEQWKKKELKDGDYYVLNKAGDIVCDYYIEILGHFDSVLTENVKEVLAPVPSYKEYNKLRKLPLKCFQLEEDNSALVVINKDMCKEGERLQEQLNEANAILKSYANRDNWSSIMDGCGYSDNALYVDDHGYSSAENYLEKWGVK